MKTNTPELDAQVSREVVRRRTFAIISHPDAGKTTLTEKLLLFGGCIDVAGAVRGRKTQRAATSDWMEMEKQRGISVSSTVLSFEYEGHQVNLLDTPGHHDFSEDTYSAKLVRDQIGHPAVLFQSKWDAEYAARENPGICFSSVRMSTSTPDGQRHPNLTW